ncbi:hypothetical protein H4R99_001305 [Coemansia sp. RSA 1722]|nr:hypothetical protein H4R99_001305 [Coemansia sp. RSA 1722]
MLPTSSKSAGKAPDTEPGTSADVPMAGVYDPDSLDGLSQTVDQREVRYEQLLDTFRASIPSFSGDIKQDHMSARNWIRKVVRWRREVLSGINNLLFIAEITRLLTGSAKQVVEYADFTQPSQILETIQRKFPHSLYQRELIKLIETGEAFVDCEGPRLMARLDRYIEELHDCAIGMVAIADAIHGLFPLYWEFLDISLTNVSSEDLVVSIQQINRRLERNDMARHTPYGKMIRVVKPKPSESTNSPSANTSKNPPKSANKPNRNAQRRAQNKSKLNLLVDLLLKERTEAAAPAAPSPPRNAPSAPPSSQSFH